MSTAEFEALFAPTAPTAAAQGVVLDIQRERADIKRRHDDNEAEITSLEEADREAAVIAILHTPDAPTEDSDRVREIDGRRRRRAAFAEALAAKDREIDRAQAAVDVAIAPRNAAVDQLVGEMNEAALTEIRAQMDAIHASLVRLFSSDHVGRALIDGEHHSRFTAINLEGKIELLRYFQRVPAIVRPRGFATTDGVFREAREAASGVVSSIRKGN